MGRARYLGHLLAIARVFFLFGFFAGSSLLPGDGAKDKTLAASKKFNDKPIFIGSERTPGS